MEEGFGRLLPAEAAWLEGVEAGTGLDGLDGETDRRIRVRLIAALCRDQALAARVGPGGINLQEIDLVEGHLDLSDLTLAWPLRLQHCRIRLDGAQAGDLLLKHLRAPRIDISHLACRHASLVGARLGGDLIAVGATFDRGLHLCDARIEGDLDLRRSRIGPIAPKIGEEHDESNGERSHDYTSRDRAIMADRVQVFGRAILNAAEVTGGIYLRNARIAGVGLLKQLTLVAPRGPAASWEGSRWEAGLHLESSKIRGGVDLSDATVSSNLSLMASLQPPEAEAAGDISFTALGLEVDGDLYGEGLRSAAPLKLLGARITGDLHLMDSHIGSGQAKTPNDQPTALDFTGAFIGGTLSLDGAMRVEGATSLQTARIGGRLLVEGHYAAERLALIADGLSVKGFARFGEAQIHDGADEEAPRPDAEEEVKDGAQEEAEKARAKGPAAPAWTPKLSVRGGLKLENARIGGLLSFADFRLEPGTKPGFRVGAAGRASDFVVLSLKGAEIGSDLYFRGPARVEGTIWLLGTRIEQDLEISGLLLQRSPLAEETDKHHHVVFNASRAEVKGEFRWFRGRLPHGFEDSFWCTQGAVRLSRMTTARLRDDFQTWPVEPYPIHLDGFAYGTIHTDRNARARERLGWRARWAVVWSLWRGRRPPAVKVGRQRRALAAEEWPRLHRQAKHRYRLPGLRSLVNGLKYGFGVGTISLLPQSRLLWLERQFRTGHGRRRDLDRGTDRLNFQPFDQLERVFRRMGLENDARTVAIRKQVRITRMYRDRPVARWWRFFAGVTVRYGYQPFRAVLLLILLLAGSTAVFNDAYHNDAVYPTLAKFQMHTRDDGPPGLADTLLWSGAQSVADPAMLSGKVMPPTYPRFDPLVFAVDTVISPISLGQQDFWYLRSDEVGVYEACAFWSLDCTSVYRAYFYLHVLLGHLLVILIALSPTSLLRLD
ncbi:unnamed protein product [Symbiodinium necroappetens]|uniref:Uncharacterized protein n=1 Tax=Symbiodinium necroappetens TaxID=1628268 RepID=A0A812WIB1_9DINO|nr:unnamed protein product [Symbiodinium necroappetens]